MSDAAPQSSARKPKGYWQSERPCAGCGTSVVTGKQIRYCKNCQISRRNEALKRGRERRRKYVPADGIDYMIREFYAKRNENGVAKSTLPPLKSIARRVGWPLWRVYRRAQNLGLSRIKERVWSQEELQLLERFAHLLPTSIAKRFRQRGFSRTASAIHSKLGRSGLRESHDFYCARRCAEFFGVDSNVVLRWIRLGYLEALERREESHGNRTWLVDDTRVQRFVRNHPTLFDIRRVDQVWFLNMLFDGKLCQEGRL